MSEEVDYERWTLKARKVHQARDQARTDDTSMDEDYDSQQQEVKMVRGPHHARHQVKLQPKNELRQLAARLVVSVLVCIFIAWLSHFAWDNYSALVTEKKTLQKELEELSWTNKIQKQQLKKFEYRAKVYQKQVDLIKTITGQIRNMDLCYLQLEKYCTLKKKKDRDPSETKEMLRLGKYLNCINEITTDYHVRIKKSFQNHTERMLGFRKAQVDLLTEGNFTEMEAQQKNAENTPAETCNYICDLDPEETVLVTTDSVFEIGWKLFKEFFY